MVKSYECITVIDPAVTDAQKNELIQKVKGIMSNTKGEVEKVEDWGRRELAYKIKGKSQGLYLWLILKGEAGFIPELEAAFKLDEKVLRHLILIRQKPAVVKAQKPGKPGAEEKPEESSKPAEEPPEGQTEPGGQEPQ